jgi:hypothetical protein
MGLALMLSPPGRAEVPAPPDGPETPEPSPPEQPEPDAPDAPQPDPKGPETLRR